LNGLADNKCAKIAPEVLRKSFATVFGGMLRNAK